MNFFLMNFFLNPLTNIFYSRKVKGKLFVGGNLRITNQKLEKESATGFMADVGCLYRQKTTGIGFVLQNIGPGVKFSKDVNPLPVNIKLGLSQKLFNKNLTIVLDADLPLDNDISGHLGVEYWYKNIIAVRAGYKTTSIEDTDALSGVSAGFGIRLKSIGIDYAFVPYGDLGFTHRISLIGKFGTVAVSERVK